MSTWWDASTGWAAWFQVRAAWPPTGAHGHGDRALPVRTSMSSPSAPTTASTAAGGTSAVRLARLVPARHRLPSRLHGHRRGAHPRSNRLFTTASDGRIMSTWWNAQRAAGAAWFQVSGGVASAGSPVTAIARYSNHIDLFVHRHRQPHLQHLVARTGRLGALGSTCRAASASPEARSRRSRESPITSTCSPSAPTGSSTARGGAPASGWAPWFRLGVS